MSLKVSEYLGNKTASKKTTKKTGNAIRELIVYAHFSKLKVL